MNTINVFETYTNRITESLTEEAVLAGENGTGYFDGLTSIQKPEGMEGDRAVFTDRYGRMGVVCFTDLGNVVIFQRHPEKDIFVSNVAPAFRNVVENGAIGSESLEWYLNSVPTNRFQYIVEQMNAAIQIRK